MDPRLRPDRRSRPTATTRVATLAADANALHEALGGDGDAVLIGHDWGAMTAYGAASTRARRGGVASSTMAVPPPAGRVGRVLPLRAAEAQLLRLPLPDRRSPSWSSGADDLAFIDNLWRDWSPSYDGKDDLAHVKDALRAPDNLAAAIGYYRAMFGGGVLGGVPPHSRRSTCTATDDGAFLADRVPESRRTCPPSPGRGPARRRPLPAPRASRRGQQAHHRLGDHALTTSSGRRQCRQQRQGVVDDRVGIVSRHAGHRITRQTTR